MNRAGILVTASKIRRSAFSLCSLINFRSISTSQLFQQQRVDERAAAAAQQKPVKRTDKVIEEKPSSVRYSKFYELINQPKNKESTEPITFAKLFRHSKFVGLGKQNNVFLFAKIVDVVGDDLHIDYGGKFNLICKRPQDENADLYMNGVTVKIRVDEFEMSAYFLSAAKDLTLLESDGAIIEFPSNKMNDLVKQEIQELMNEVRY